jgi:PHD/YefM family antitoxin component YafN of YafNO toxin-antitoxin module
MSITATSSEVQKNFGAFHDRALAEPVRVTRYGRETVFIISAATFHSLKQGQRAAIATAELSEDELALVAAAEIPQGYRYSLSEIE